MSLTWHYRPADLLFSTMTDTKTSSVVDTTAQLQSSNVRFVQSSSSSLRTLSSLATDRLIVLFTPAIPLTDAHKREHGSEDPFECFGRALSKRHARVRHVPFVAKVGLTDLHVAWIRRAAAIVVVTCEPTLPADANDNSNMSGQVKFAADVSDTLSSIQGASPNIPLSCVYITPLAAAPQGTGNYENLLACSSYSVANMEKAASMLIC